MAEKKPNRFRAVRIPRVDISRLRQPAGAPDHPTPSDAEETVAVMTEDTAEVATAEPVAATAEDVSEAAAEKPFLGLHEGLLAAEKLHREQKLEESLALLLKLHEAHPESSHPPARAAGLLLHFRRIAEAETLLASRQPQFPDIEAFFVLYARAADMRRDAEASIQRWEEVRWRFPDLADGYSAGAAALRNLQRYDEAEAILRDGIERVGLGDRIELHAESAYLAGAQRHWAEAAERWDRARSRFPDAWLPHAALGAVLREDGRAEESETILSAAVERWPHQRDVLAEHARAATALRSWEAAVSRWEKVRAVDADFWPAYTEGAAALAQLGRGTAAGALLSQATERFPAQPYPVVALARLRNTLGDLAGTADAWAVTRQRFPELREGYLGGAPALRGLGRYDEADAVLTAARGRFGQDRDVMLEQITLAYAQEDWPQAAAFCTEAIALFPDDAQFRRLAFETHLRSVDAADEQKSIAGVIAAPAGDELSDRDRLMNFESLGGTGHGCEFGIYQRSRGAEPLGLLRWTDLNQDQLIDALEQEFAGVGSAEQTVIFIPETKLRPQYWTRDKRFYMVSATQVFVDEVAEEKLFPQLCRRLVFLRNKMISDLKDGEKIFVYKNMFRNLTEAELERMYSAIHRYGDSTIFYLRYADAAHPAGVVEWVRPGLLQGYVEHFAHSPQEEYLGDQHEAFDRLTRVAYSLWKAAR